MEGLRSSQAGEQTPGPRQRLGPSGHPKFRALSPGACATGKSSRRSEVLPVTESQHHRIVGVGRDLCGSCSPTLLPKQGHLQQAAQDLVQAGLESLQRRRLHHLPGQPVPVF